MIGTAILLASLLLTARDEPAIPTGDLEAIWRRDYPRAAAHWDAITREFVAKGRFSFRWNNGATTITPQLTVATSGEKMLFIREGRMTKMSGKPDHPLGSSVDCQTSELEFTLEKPSTSKYYILKSYGIYKEDDESDFNYWYNQYAKVATTYYGTSLLQRVRHPSFLLKSINLVKQGGGDLVRVGYSYEGKYVFESGTVDLDAGKNWAIRGVDVSCKSKKDNTIWAFTMNVEYEKVNETQFFPNRMESYNRTRKPGIYEQAILDYDQITLGNVSEDLFLRSTYGVPDIPLSPAPRDSVFTLRNPLFWLALAATIVSFALLRTFRSRGERVK